MADLISREAVLDILKFKPIDDGGLVDDCIMQVLALAKSKINKLPAADAVEVVRCKDCEEEQLCRLAQRFGKCGYCSEGERREENAAD